MSLYYVTEQQIDDSVNYATTRWAKKQRAYCEARNDVADEDRRILYDVYGKMAEFGVSNALGEGQPDTSVYLGANHDADLVVAGFDLHIKSTLASSKVDSWLIERNAPVFTNPKPQDQFVFVVVRDDLPGLPVEIKWVLPATLVRQIHVSEKLWRSPFNMKLAATKAAIYEDDLTYHPAFTGYRV